jgi:hypothetical protein
MAKLSARGCTVLARVEKDVTVAEGRTCRFHRALRSDGRILGRANYLGLAPYADKWTVRPSRILETLTPAVVQAWVDEKLAAGWVRS